MEAIICEDMAEFDSLNVQIWAWMVQPEHGGAHGDKWANPRIHPTDGRIAMPVDMPRMGGSLTEAQTERVETLTPDWGAD